MRRKEPLVACVNWLHADHTDLPNFGYGVVGWVGSDGDEPTGDLCEKCEVKRLAALAALIREPVEAQK